MGQPSLGADVLAWNHGRRGLFRTGYSTQGFSRLRAAAQTRLVGIRGEFYDLTWMVSSRRARTLAGTTLAALVAAGSALSAGGPDPRSMTLRLSDLPPHLVLVRAETGRYDAARAARTDSVPASAFRAHGYLAGYELDATRRRNLSAGPAQIISAASLWRNADGARWSLARTVGSSQAHHFRALSTGRRIGAESHLYSYTLQEGTNLLRVYALGWRDGRVRATVLVAGVQSVVTPHAAIRLARAQERRITAELTP